MKIHSPDHRAFSGALLLLSLLAFSGPGCSTQVMIPPSAQDHAPIITVTSFPSGAGSAAVERETTSTAGPNKVAQGVRLLLSASAKNPGGVKSLTVLVTKNRQTIYQGTATATADSSNKGPNLLALVNSTGPAGPIGAIMDVKVDSPVEILATATNFNGMTSHLSVTEDPQPIQVVANASPVDIARGGSSNLRWTTQWILDGSTLSIQPSVMSGFVPFTGSVVVNPGASTQYVFSAKTPFSSTTASATVNVKSKPHIDSFTCNPNPNAYLPHGHPITLQWNVSNSGSGLTVTLVGKAGDGVNWGFQAPLFNKTVGSSDTFTYTPMVEWTQYTLTATDSFGNDSGQIQIQTDINHPPR